MTRKTIIVALTVALSAGAHGCDDGDGKSSANAEESKAKGATEEDGAEKKGGLDEAKVKGLLADLSDRDKEKAAIAELEKLGADAIPLMKEELENQCKKIAATSGGREQRSHAMTAEALAKIMKKQGEPGKSAIKEVIGVSTDSAGLIRKKCQK